MRMCAGCKKRVETDELIRFVEFEGKPLPDLARKLPGRGFNVCPTKECLKAFLKKRYGRRVSFEEVYADTVRALRDYVLHLLSLCHKAGLTVVGQDEVKRLPMKEGVLILASDLSEGTKRRLRERFSAVLDSLFSSEEIGNALRKDRRAGVVFVERVGLGRKLYENAVKLKKLIGEES